MNEGINNPRALPEEFAELANEVSTSLLRLGAMLRIKKAPEGVIAALTNLSDLFTEAMARTDVWVDTGEELPTLGNIAQLLKMVQEKGTKS